jgi:hypothetical protein
MSKMDNLRAMREAKYAEAAKRSAAAKGAGSKPARLAPTTAPPAASARGAGASATTSQTSGAAEPGLCGHRNMSGRSCTREHGHAAKSHRYS